MIIVKHTINKKDLPQLDIGLKDLIYDIETTGFSAKYAFIYMIGMLYKDDSSDGTSNGSSDDYILEQWFREKDSDEYEILFRFNQRLLEIDVLYSFNGDQFDMPFIKKRMALYDMTLNADVHNTLVSNATKDPSSYITSKDMLKLMRPFKKVLGLENMKLKTVEAYFGYEREDPFTGGDLIKLYTTYLESKDESLFKTLLLHNFEDLLGLGKLISHITFVEMLKDYKNEQLDIELLESTIENNLYKGVFTLPVAYDFTIETALFQLTATGHKATITVPTAVETLKLYFDNPSDYYYLPAEDYAVHKSIGKFVHKDHRIKATRDNCYVKKEDFFLPGYRHYELPLHLYYKETKDPVGYYSVQDLVESNSFDSYIRKLMRL